MVEHFRSSSRSALGTATTVDSPALFLRNIIRKVGAAIGKTAGPVLRGVAKTAGPVLRRVARMVGRAFGR
jgi:hypothetical protein